MELAVGNFFLGFVHTIDDNADEEVKHDHGAKHDKTNKVGSSDQWLCLGGDVHAGGALVIACVALRSVNLDVHDIGPVF